MPVPAPTAPSSTAGAGLGHSLGHVGRSTCTDARVAQPAVVALADDRDDHVVDADGRIGRDRNGDGAVHHAAHGMGRGEIDRRLEDSPFADLDRARQLAGAVEHSRAGRDGLLQEGLDRPRQDRGHARAGDRRLVAPDRDVADGDAGNVGDRVSRAGLQFADPQAVARAGSSRSSSRRRLGSPDDARDARGLRRALPAARAGRGDLCRRAHARHRVARSGRTRSWLRSARRLPPSRTTTPRFSPCTIRDCVEFLGSAWTEWEASGLAEEPGQDRVVPYVFAHEKLGARREPAATWALPGYFAYDTMTLIGPGTWEAARAAVDASLTAVDLVTAGAPHAYACVRPPGHHACRAAYGGSCYLNNAAVAAEAMRRQARGGRCSGHRRASRQRHAGDLLGPARCHRRVGARRSRSRLVPALPRLRGRDRGRREPEPPAGAGRGRRGVARGSSAQAAEWIDADALVVSLGVDAAAADPESPLRVSSDGFREAGRIIGALGAADGARPGGRLRPRDARPARRWTFLSGVESTG